MKKKSTGFLVFVEHADVITFWPTRKQAQAHAQEFVELGWPRPVIWKIKYKVKFNRKPTEENYSSHILWNPGKLS